VSNLMDFTYGNNEAFLKTALINLQLNSSFFGTILSSLNYDRIDIRFDRINNPNELAYSVVEDILREDGSRGANLHIVIGLNKIAFGPNGRQITLEEAITHELAHRYAELSGRRDDEGLAREYEGLVADQLKLTDESDPDRPRATRDVDGVDQWKADWTDTYCFVAGTRILVEEGSGADGYIPIEQIEVGQIVRSFQKGGSLVSGKVIRLFKNCANELIELTPVGDKHLLGSSVESTVATPGHVFLNEFGEFERVDSIIARGGSLVHFDGELEQVKARRIV
jgi:hypothetical protein